MAEAIKIVVECSGGVVQAVYASAPDVEVQILDWDDDENLEISDDAVSKCEVLSEQTNSMHPVY